jgi:hypothetical protein
MRQQKLPRRREDPLRMYFAILGVLAVSLQKLLRRANEALDVPAYPDVPVAHARAPNLRVRDW